MPTTQTENPDTSYTLNPEVGPTSIDNVEVYVEEHDDYVSLTGEADGREFMDLETGSLGRDLSEADVSEVVEAELGTNFEYNGTEPQTSRTIEYTHSLDILNGSEVEMDFQHRQYDGTGTDELRIEGKVDGETYFEIETTDDGYWGSTDAERLFRQETAEGFDSDNFTN